MLKEILDSLSDEQKELLMYSFESQQPYYLEYKPGHYIGVNTASNPNLIATETQGVWACGTFNSG